MNARPALAAVLLLTAWSIVAPAQRLSRTAIPEHYDIHVAPDFASDTFGGHVAIKVRIASPTQSITLNTAEIDVHEATARLLSEPSEQPGLRHHPARGD
jgi:hypothetical protein